MTNLKEFDDFLEKNFANYRLLVGGLDEMTQEFTLGDLKAMTKQE